jgi:hypothetical protein
VSLRAAASGGDSISRRRCRSAAGHGITGQGEAATGEHDLVILDVMLPGRDGFQARPSSCLRHGVRRLSRSCGGVKTDQRSCEGGRPQFRRVPARYRAEAAAPRETGDPEEGGPHERKGVPAATPRPPRARSTCTSPGFGRCWLSRIIRTTCSLCAAAGIGVSQSAGPFRLRILPGTELPASLGGEASTWSPN